MEGGAYTVAALLEYGAFGLIVVLAVALIAAGTLLRQEKRNRFLLWVMMGYMSAWTLWVLWNTVRMVLYLRGMMR